MRIFTITNFKGGVGKTTVAANLAWAAAHFKMSPQRVLLIDLDGQCNLTDWAEASGEKDIHDVLFSGDPVADAIVSTTHGFDIVPGSPELRGADAEFAKNPAILAKLSTELATVAERYDLCLIDTSPSDSVLVSAALVASNEVIVVMRNEQGSLAGLNAVEKQVETFKPFNPDLRLSGVVLNAVSRRAQESRAALTVLQETVQSRGYHLYPFLSSSEYPAGATRAHRAILDYHPAKYSQVYQEWRELSLEFLKEVGVNG